MEQELALNHLQQTTHDVVRALAFVPWNSTPLEVYIPLDYRGPRNVTIDSSDFKLCAAHIDHIVQPPFTSYTFEILDRTGRSHAFEVFVTAREDLPINQALSMEGEGRLPFRGGVVVIQRGGTQKKPGKHVPINLVLAPEVSSVLLQEGNIASFDRGGASKRRVRHPRKQASTSPQSNAQGSNKTVDGKDLVQDEHRNGGLESGVEGE